MTAPDDDWRKRIENGGTWDDPTSQYPTNESSGTGYPQAPGPVYGAPGSGPAYPPPPGFTQPPAMQQFAGVPGYGFAGADPGAPFGRDPITGEPLSDKSKVAAGLLQILLPFLSICGVGRLYMGSTVLGLVQLLGMFFAIVMSFLLIGIPFVIGFWLWSVIDGIMILVGNVRDGRGLKLRS
ncbi:TM2 domain-containing protein [Rhodococcus sp. NPDC058514]|uniref:TM2 domain-containing protein n=1 Tax=unclassified Rhodococcus (in: high G+C Gram-positive bacteria) TaxID=192944 RepID=UPI0036574C01